MKRIFFIIMAVLFMGILPGTKVWATDQGSISVKYVDANGKEESHECTVLTTVLISSKPEGLSGGWYVVDGNITYSKDLHFGTNQDNSNDVNLILVDNSILNAPRINYIEQGTFTVYGQSGGTGKIVSNCSNNHGINCNGNLTINGGVIEATSTSNLGICCSGNFIMNSGKVTAIGKTNGIQADGDGSERTATIKLRSSSDYLIAYGKGDNAIAGFNPITVGTDLAIRAGESDSAAGRVQSIGAEEYVEIRKPVASITDGNNTTNYASVQDAIKAASDTDTVKLIADVTTSKTITVTGTGTKTLDLNGYGIRYTGTTTGSVIKIGDTGQNSGNLTLKDSNSTRKHYITLTNGRGTAVSDTMSDGAIEVTGGYITGGYDDSGNGGAGINVNGSTFTMKAGTIIGNVITTDGGNGAGVNTSGASTFTMEGGKIAYNTGAGNSGGVYIGGPSTGDAVGTFTMKGGSIEHNSSTNRGGGGSGGGVFVIGKFTMNNGTISGNEAVCGGGVAIASSESTFTMTGGTISDNVATDSGGGVFVNNDTHFTMSGGSIKNNSATKEGGGVYVQRTTTNHTTTNHTTTMTLSGPSEINGNHRSDNTESNVYLLNPDGSTNPDTVITIVGELKNKTPIGVKRIKYYTSTPVPGAITSGWDDKMPDDADPAKYFTSEDPKYAIRLKNGEGELAETTDAYTVTFTVLNGKWDDDSTGSKTAKVYKFSDSSESPRLSTYQIPAVGNKPNSGYTTGSWSPALSTLITKDTTFTYTYDKVSAPSPDPGPGPVNPTPDPTPTQTPEPSPEPTQAPEPSPEPTTAPEPTQAPLPTPEPDPANNVDPTKDPSAGKTVETETTNEENGVKTTEQTNTDGSKTTIVEDSNTNTKTVVVENADKSKVTQTTSEDATTGTKTESAKEEKENGDFVEKTVITDSTGATTEKTASQTTNEDKSVTTTEGNKNVDGTSDMLEKTEQTNGDFEQKYYEMDAAGKVTLAETASKTTAADGTVTEKVETKDQTGTKETEVKKDATGKTTDISTKETSLDGKTTEATYEPQGTSVAVSNIKSTDSVLVIPATVKGAEAVFPVTEIGAGALEGQSLESVSIPETITKVDKNAFSGCGITEMDIEGKITKKMFAKNSLKDNGTGKKGKGLTITVDSKKDAKTLKKQLAKAGAKKAKVVVR